MHASAYIATSPIDFNQVLGDFGLDYEQFTFVDFGCGKGRVLLMASALPFAAIVGIEFSTALSRIARENLRTYSGPRACRNVRIKTMDVVEYELPIGPLVLFFYHPFDDVVMSQVVENICKSYRDLPRRIIVLYFKPVHSQAWENVTFLRKKRTTGLYDLYDSLDDKSDPPGGD